MKRAISCIRECATDAMGWMGRLLPFCALCISVHAASDIVFADFEGYNYGAWKVEGAAFGNGPSEGALPGQMSVSGYAGKGLANSYHGEDDARGRLVSPEFVIDRKYISFLIGGGGFEGKTCIDLFIGNRAVRSTTGPNTEPGGSEDLAQAGWDVSEFVGQSARIEIIDDATGGWGHINVDQIVFTDTKPVVAPRLLRHPARQFDAVKNWLNLPVKNGAKKRFVTVTSDGAIVRRLESELADGKPDWLAPLDVSPWRGRNVVVSVNEMPEDSLALKQIQDSDQPLGEEMLYDEPLRPQFHFSAKRGWLNDPNGLVFYNGEYHMFFQHSPASWGDAMKHWGHAVSKDLVHWTELGEALYPDERGAIWSGSAAVDWKNTSGFGADGKPPLILIYTAAGNPFVQCVAYSTDGRTFVHYKGNPAIGSISGGNRDPRLLWHEPTQRWVVALYVEKERRHSIHFFTSTNARDWTQASVANGGSDGSSFLFECPDFFQLAVDGDASRKKWVLTAASTEYEAGSFDGFVFTPETSALPGEQGHGFRAPQAFNKEPFYAPQTFSDEPHGRRVQIGWLQAATPGMPFNQSMSIPSELSLVTRADGPRLARNPIKELESLRIEAHSAGPITLKETDLNPLSAIKGELFEMRAEFNCKEAADVAFDVRGVAIGYDCKKQELSVNGHRAAAPLCAGGVQRLAIYVDRTCVEVFASDGLAYFPIPINVQAERRSLGVSVHGGSAKFARLDVYQLRSAWK